MVLYCKCLNIAVDPAEAKLEPVSDINTPVPALVQTSLAGGNYGTMPPGQLNIKFSFLVQQVASDAYFIYTCRNCGMAACAVSPSLNVIVLNGKLLSEAEGCEARLSSDYSAAYGIIIEAAAASGTSEQAGDSLGAMPSPPSTAAVAYLQRQLSNFLLSEESKMEEDVRRYEAGARERYRLLCESNSRQFQQLCSSLARSAPSRDDDSDSAYERSSTSVDETTSGASTNRAKATAVESAVTARVRTAATGIRQSSSNSDALFDLDEDEGERGDPFVCSDDEDKRTSDADAAGGTVEVTGVNIARNNSRQNGSQASRLSTSAAMPIPSAMRRRKSQAASDSDDSISDEEGRMPDMKDMGASIKALAQSVGYDGTEMFGDLPRPRLNTHDRLLM